MRKSPPIYARENMTTVDAAARLGVTRARVVQMIEEGKLKAIKEGRDWRVDEASVEAELRRRGAGG